MRLSLFILADWLQKYHPVCSISEGARTIRNVRMFSDWHRFTDSNVYISRTGGDVGGVICMHKNDYLLLDTDDENQVMNDIMDAFDHYNDWSDSLNRDLRQLSLQQILDASADILGSTLMLADASYYILAHTADEQAFANDDAFQSVRLHGIMDISHIMNVERDSKIREHRRHSYIQDTGGFSVCPSVRNLFTGGNHWGWLIRASSSHSPGQMDVQDELGDILEQWMQLHQEQQSLLELGGVFLSILDGSYPSRDSVLFQLRLMGWQPQEEKWVYAIGGGDKTLALPHKVEQLGAGVRGFVYEDCVVALFHGTALERQRFHGHLTELLSKSGCRCGVSTGFTDFFVLRAQYELAQAARDLGDGLLCFFENVTLPYAIDILEKQCHSWLFHPALKLLFAYDRENNTEFYETLEHYLHQERSIARTAEEMGLHRNTLLYRIARIRELTQLNLENPEVRLHLLLSYAIEGRHKAGEI